MVVSAYVYLSNDNVALGSKIEHEGNLYIVMHKIVLDRKIHNNRYAYLIFNPYDLSSSF